jgi:hypothetical protein
VRPARRWQMPSPRRNGGCARLGSSGRALSVVLIRGDLCDARGTDTGCRSGGMLAVVRGHYWQLPRRECHGWLHNTEPGAAGRLSHFARRRQFLTKQPSISFTRPLFMLRPYCLSSGAEDETTRDRPIYCWKTLVMVNEIPARLLTVRELRQALDKAHPDQVVIFALTNQDLASLETPLHNGLGISFAVRVDRAGAEGPVFRLVPGQPRQARSPQA